MWSGGVQMGGKQVNHFSQVLPWSTQTFNYLQLSLLTGSTVTVHFFVLFDLICCRAQVTTASTGRRAVTGWAPTATRPKVSTWSCANRPSCASRRRPAATWSPRRTAPSAPPDSASRRRRAGSFEDANYALPRPSPRPAPFFPKDAKTMLVYFQ